MRLDVAICIGFAEIEAGEECAVRLDVAVVLTIAGFRHGLATPVLEAPTPGVVGLGLAFQIAATAIDTDLEDTLRLGVAFIFTGQSLRTPVFQATAPERPDPGEAFIFRLTLIQAVFK